MYGIRSLAESCRRFTPVLLLLGAAGLAQESQPAERRLTGQVLNHMGGGIANAGVQVTFVPGDDSPKHHVESTKTDELGDFAVPLPADFAGRAVVQVSLTGYTTHEQDLPIDPHAESPFAYAELEGAGSVEGVVRRAETQQPVAGAHVVVSDGFKDWEADTTEDGRFRVEKLPPAELRIIVTADGFAEHRQTLTPETRDAPLTIDLGPEWIAEVRVVDHAGTAVPDAVIDAAYSDNTQLRDALTDSAGVAKFTGLPPTIDGLALRVQHPDFATMTEYDVRVDRPAEGAFASVTVTLERGAIVAGRVVDAASEEPIAMARVTVGAAMSPGAPMAWTDDEGRFEVTGAAAGERVVTVHAPSLSPTASRAVLKSGERSEINFALQAGRTVRGRVTNDADEPVERATVVIDNWQGFETLGLKSMTNASGEFAIENAPMDAFSIAAFAMGCEPVTLDVPAETGPLKIVLHGVKPAAPPLAVGASAPDFSLTATNGTRVALSEMRGKYVFLDFWATWCGPCVVELPHVRELYDATKSRPDLIIVGVSLDSDRKALDRFVKEKKIDWLQVFEDGGAAKAADAFGVRAIPATFLIGPDGTVIASGLRGPSMKETVIRHLDARTRADGT